MAHNHDISSPCWNIPPAPFHVLSLNLHLFLSLVTFLIIVSLHFLFISNWITSIIFVIFLYNGTLYYFSQHAFPAFSPTCDTASRCVHMCKRTVFTAAWIKGIWALQAKSCNQIPRGGQIRPGLSKSHKCCLKIILAIYNNCLYSRRGSP